MRAAVCDLVVFDYDEAGDEKIDGDKVEGEVRECSAPFLRGRVCWLEDEDCLGEGEEGGGVEKGMCGEEYERVQKDSCPD